MRNYIRILDVFSVLGVDVRDVIKELCDLAKKDDLIIRTVANGITIAIWPHSTPEEVFRDWDSQLAGKEN